MQVTVYRMRDRGTRYDARNPALRKGVKGWLRFLHVSDDYGRRTVAQLVAGQGSHEDLIPPLQDAQIRRIDGVMHLVGVEKVGYDGRHERGARFKQSWLCAGDEAQALAFLDRVTYQTDNPFEEMDYLDETRFNNGWTVGYVIVGDWIDLRTSKPWGKFGGLTGLVLISTVHSRLERTTL